jgi:protein-disulfide isomerase
MSKTFWAILAAIVIIFTGIVVFNKKEANAPTTNAAPTNHVVGDGSAGVALVEYGDFECPACASYFPIVEQVVAKYKGQITFQFRHLPIIQIHQSALAASRAAEAAGKQNKFWEMYRALYQNQPGWAANSNASAVFEQYAQQLGLDVAQFKIDVTSPATNDVINADIAEFRKTGQEVSTPTFFLDGKYVKPDATVEAFSKLIDEAIAAKAKNQ